MNKEDFEKQLLKINPLRLACDMAVGEQPTVKIDGVPVHMEVCYSAIAWDIAYNKGTEEAKDEEVNSAIIDLVLDWIASGQAWKDFLQEKQKGINYD